MTLKVYNPNNEPLGFLNNVFDLKIVKEISGMQELSFYVPINSPEARLLELEGYIYPDGEQLFVIRELNQQGNDIEVYCTLAIENLYGFCWEEIAKKSTSLVGAFEYVLQHTGWKFVNKTTTPARTRDIFIQNQTVWEALQVLCEVYFIEITVDIHSHTITAYDRVGKDTGTFFISDMNLVNFRKDTSTHKLITRLIPIGKDGLKITSVNNGKEYIDNNTYSNKLLYGMWVQTAYTNPSQLKEDATQWLEEYAKPFISYSVDIVDLYRKTGNSLFQFNIGDTVTIIDKLSEEKVQQRVVKMTLYPHRPELNNIELSNKNKTFQDYFKMIQLMNNMANHFIQTSGSATGTGDTNIDKTPGANSVSGVHIQNGSITADKLVANSITTDKLQANSITTNHLQANSISTEHLQANSVTADKIHANSITTDKLQASSITTDKLQANSVTTDKLQAKSITADKIQSKSISAEHLQSNIIDTEQLFANSITSDKIQSGAITTEKLDANCVNTDHLIANSITADKIQSDTITTEHLQSGSITADKIGASAITTDHLQAGVVDTIHLKADSITADHIQSGVITADSTIIAEGAIGNAQISSIEANKINAGEIDTSKVKIKGEDGYLFIENNTLYVVDNHKHIRCELGAIEDNSNYGFIVRGVDGQTILIDHNGVHNAGITDGAIDNRKVSENANISGKKLDIDSVIRTINEDGSVSIQGTKVQVGSTTLDIELSNQNNLINEHTTQLTNQQSSIQANTNAIKLKVDNQTYIQDKTDMTSKLQKNTSAIDILEKEVALKVEQSDIDDSVNTAKSEIKLTTDAISQKVSKVESAVDGYESRISNAESKVTDTAITNTVKKAQFIKDIEGSITEVESTISNIEQTADSITHRVNGLDGKYTEIQQTIDRIDLTGKVSFSDLNTPGKTTINGSNITTGTVNGNLIQGGTIKGALLQTYSNDDTRGVRITQESMLLNNTSFFYNTGGNFNIQAKEGFNIGSMENIYLMPGLRASGTASGYGEVVIPDSTLRTQRLNVVDSATVSGTVYTTKLSVSDTITGRGNLKLTRGTVYIPRIGSYITSDYLGGGSGYIALADTGAMHFLYSSTSSASLSRGSIYLPGANSTVTTDQVASGGGIMCCVDSGNFHFITKGASPSSIYARNVSATYSLEDEVMAIDDKSALGIINEVPVVNTQEGFRLNAPRNRTAENDVVSVATDEVTGKSSVHADYNSAIATMWKAIQELQSEINSLKEENKELRDLINKGE